MKPKEKSKTASPRRGAGSQAAITVHHPNAAAIDIGATMHMAAVGVDRSSEPVRSFGTFTDNFYKLADWFVECGAYCLTEECYPAEADLTSTDHWLGVMFLVRLAPAEGLWAGRSAFDSQPARGPGGSDAAVEDCSARPASAVSAALRRRDPGQRPGRMENLNQDLALHTLQKDRVPSLAGNQFRLVLQTGALWLLHSVRLAAPKRSRWRGATFATIRAMLVKIAVRVEEVRTKIKRSFPCHLPHADALTFIVGRPCPQAP